MRRSSLIIRSIWAACLLIATANHARILVRHGLFWDYGGFAPASAVYWSSLTIVDPIAALLLFVRPKMGILATIVLIATNVIHNLGVAAHFAPEGEFLTRISNPFTISQIGFMVFVGATARLAWKGVESSRRSQPIQTARPSRSVRKRTWRKPLSYNLPPMPRSARLAPDRASAL